MHMEFETKRLQVDYEVIVWHFLGSVKHCEIGDIQLEECEEEEEDKRHGIWRANVDCLDREKYKIF